MHKILNIKSLLLLAFPVLALVSIGIVLLDGTATATPASGITATPIAAGVLPESIPTKFKQAKAGFGRGTDVSQIVVVKFDLQPGGSFGWHRHGGPVWAVVASGTLTLYDGDDPACHAHVFPAGSALLDPGEHTHIGRNEGDEPLEIYATFMLPEDGETRIDADDSGNCPF